MLSVLFGEVPEVFKQLLEFYFEKGDRILDLTFGHAKLWRETYIDDYVIVSNDSDPDSPAQFHIPFDQLNSAFSSDLYFKKIYFKGIIYDPPYLYGRPSHYLLTSEEKDLDWKPQKTKWTVDKQIETAKVLNEQLPDLLHPNGFIIVKVMNSRIKGKLIRNNQLICENFTNFELKDEYIYIRTNMGFYRNPATPQTAHGYYLIFRKKES